MTYFRTMATTRKIFWIYILATGSRLGGCSRDEIEGLNIKTTNITTDEFYAVILDRESCHCNRPHGITRNRGDFLAAEVMKS